MAYDEHFADCIRNVLPSKPIALEEKKMMGGIWLKADDKMCVGTHQDKPTLQNYLVASVGMYAMKQPCKSRDAGLSILQENLSSDGA